MSFQERFIFNNQENGDIIRNEHLVRYQFVSKFVKHQRVLDIACGSGYGSAILAQAGALQVIGMDKSAEAVKTASAEYNLCNLTYKEGDAENISAPDKSFDVVVSLETVEHLSNQDKYIQELARVAKDEALVFISTPNKQVFGNQNPFHVKELTKSEFENLLKSAFPFVVILEQANAVVSFLKASGDTSLKETQITSASEPLYFLAICSKREIAEKDFAGEGLASLSVKVLERMKNNPVLKLSDKFYPLFAKFFRK
jgi:2-polyprenyl-3-methyl-5-hydroxy-6-metoxy-1,4-benzoquinol methylase